MKKILVMLVAVMVTASAKADLFSFGVKGGVNVTQMSLSVDKYNITSNNNAGFFVGPTVKLSLIAGLGCDAAVLYNQTQFKVDSDEATVNSTTLKQQSIAVPVNVRYSVGLGSLANIFVFAGPQFSFNVGDTNVNFMKDLADWENKKTQFSVNVGLGATVLSHLQVTANYNIACGNVTELKGIGVLDGYKFATAKTNIWQIGLAYWF